MGRRYKRRKMREIETAQAEDGTFLAGRHEESPFTKY
jgi:hypothetical protein